MSADWEDGIDSEEPPSYTVPNLELMAAILIGMKAAGEADSYDFPATLEVLLRRAAEDLEEAGCCKNRPDTLDGKWRGIANEIVGRLDAKSKALASKYTGYTNDGVDGSSKLHAAIVKTIAPSRFFPD